MMAARAHSCDICWPAPDGLVLRVRLAPKSSRDEIAGREDTAEGPALRARVRAVPEDGRANAALEKLVADWLDVARTAVAVTGGAKSRVKRVTVAGEAGALMRTLEARLAAIALRT
jgi:hypothetical protein